jgi:ATP-dependent exoDNAse (exonuclease V) alpha subunit
VLNNDIRTLRDQTGQLGKSHTVATETGKKSFTINDRIRFQLNERDLGVKNGSLGIIEALNPVSSPSNSTAPTHACTSTPNSSST